jgi:hypothetical protein
MPSIESDDRGFSELIASLYQHGNFSIAVAAAR